VKFMLATAAVFSMTLGLMACSSGEKNDAPSSTEALSDDEFVSEVLEALATRVADVREATWFVEQEDLTQQHYESCVANSSKLDCLREFEEDVDAYVSGCLLFLVADLCMYELELVAVNHEWSIPDYRRDDILVSEEAFHDFLVECLSTDGEAFCLSLVAATIEARYDLCDDLWGEVDCTELLGELKARATNYRREVIDPVRGG